MGIRDTSYYGWIDYSFDSEPNNAGSISSCSFSKVFSKNGSVYLCGVKYILDPFESVSCVWRLNSSKMTFQEIDSVYSPVGYSNITSFCMNSSGELFTCGMQDELSTTENWSVRKSSNNLPNSFVYIDNFNRNAGQDRPWQIVCDSKDHIYVVGSEEVKSPDQKFNWIVRRSLDGTSGSFLYIDSRNRDNLYDVASCIAVDSSDNVYVAGIEGSGSYVNWVVKSSIIDPAIGFAESGSFSYVDILNSSYSDKDIEPTCMAIDSNNNIYIAGAEMSASVYCWIVRKSATGLTKSFSYVDSYRLTNGYLTWPTSISIDSNNCVYVCGYEMSADATVANWIVRKSTTGQSGTFLEIDRKNWFGGSGLNIAADVFIDKSDNRIYVCGLANSSGKLRAAKFTANSSSIGPRMLCPSFGYLFSESISSRSRYKI